MRNAKLLILCLLLPFISSCSKPIITKSIPLNEFIAINLHTDYQANFNPLQEIEVSISGKVKEDGIDIFMDFSRCDKEGICTVSLQTNDDETSKITFTPNTITAELVQVHFDNYDRYPLNTCSNKNTLSYTNIVIEEGIYILKRNELILVNNSHQETIDTDIINMDSSTDLYNNGDYIYYAKTDGVYQYDIDSKTIKNIYPTTDISNLLAVKDNWIYYTGLINMYSGQAQVYGVNVETQESKSFLTIEKGHTGQGKITIHEDIIYYIGMESEPYTQYICGIQMSSGTMQSYNVNKLNDTSPIVVHEDIPYALADGRIINVVTNEVYFELDTPIENFYFVPQGILVITYDTKYSTGLYKSNELVWKGNFPITEYELSVVDNIVYYLQKKSVYGIDLETGETIHSFNKTPYSSIAVYQNNLYLFKE